MSKIVQTAYKYQGNSLWFSQVNEPILELSTKEILNNCSDTVHFRSRINIGRVCGSPEGVVGRASWHPQ